MAHANVSTTVAATVGASARLDARGRISIAANSNHLVNASSLGAAAFCVNESVRYARERKPFGEELARNQGIQFPLVELQTEAEMLRLLIRATAAAMDTMAKPEIAKRLGHRVSMCNYRANRLCCEAADWAMQVHGGGGMSQDFPLAYFSDETQAAYRDQLRGRDETIATMSSGRTRPASSPADDGRPAGGHAAG